MAGLDKILEHIRLDAESEVKKVITEAEREASKIVEKAKKDAAVHMEALSEKAQADYNDKLKRGESAASLRERRMILEAKQEMIEEVINNAKESLYRLPDSEYFEVLANMAKKYSTGEKGQLLLNPADKKRVTGDFGKKIESAGLILSEKTRHIDGGFVLEYGDVEENCSFEALFAAEKEVLQDKVGTLLFG